MQKTLVICSLAVALLAAAGCRPKDKAPAAGSVAPAGRAAAVLLFEDHLDFAAADAPAAGAELYRAQVDGLAQALAARGVDARTLLVPPEGVAAVDLDAYSAVLVVDTLVIPPGLRAQLERYVQQGGLLVGLYEVGRFPGAWVDPWPFASLFGLRALIPSRGGAGVLEAPPGYYRHADLLDKASPLFAGVEGRMDWGPAARHVWPVEAAGATVLASFPTHLALSATSPVPEEVQEPLPAVTEHMTGEGRAIFISVLPSARQFDGWGQAPEAVALLARIVASGRPAAGDVRAAQPLDLQLAANRLGYLPGTPRTLVLRGRGGDVAAPLTGSYRVLDAGEREIARGELAPWPQVMWHSRFARVELDDALPPGLYTVKAVASGVEASAAVRLLGADESGIVLLRGPERILETLRCGELCHSDAPVPGGLHAGAEDSTVRMDDMLCTLEALAQFVAADPANDRLRFELERTAMWCSRMFDPSNGLPYRAVQPVGGAAPGVPAREDLRPRELVRGATWEEAALYAAVLARAVPPVRNHISKQLAQEMAAVAERAYLRIRREELSSTAAIGARIWAAVEVHRISFQPDYLEEAQREATRLFTRQVDAGKIPGVEVYGDFFADGERVLLTPASYERARTRGLYRGLVELYRTMPAGTRKDDVRAVIDRFMNGFLAGTAALSPYGQFAAALEPAGPLRPRPAGRSGYEPPERFRVRWFSHRGSPIGERGLSRDLLTLAGVALDWARETEQPELRRLALQQLNWIGGVNPLGAALVTESGVLIDGITGRADHPVVSGSEPSLPPNTAWLTLSGLLPPPSAP